MPPMVLRDDAFSETAHSLIGLIGRFFGLDLKSAINQGQAREYGRITHFLPPPTWGHDFPWVIVTQPVAIFQTPGCHMKDMDIIFPEIPFVLLYVEWFDHSAY